VPQDHKKGVGKMAAPEFTKEMRVRFEALYNKASYAARYFFDFTKEEDREAVSAYLPPEEATELLSIWEAINAYGRTKGWK
jgi:hypothetical protein